MGKILIIDDDRTIAKILLKVLNKKAGVDADTATSFEDVKSQVEPNPENYSIAICDYNLPDAPNGETVDYLISKNIPVIVLTASFDSDVRDRMLSKKIVDYVVKRSTRELDYLAYLVKRVFNNRNIKILVIDDSLTHRDSMASILRNQLFQVITASGGREALRIVQENPDIKMIITDYYMPDVDGFDVLLELRKNFKKDQMAIIVTSGFGGNEIIPKFLKAGANDYIQKPFSNEEFVCRVNMNIDTLEMIATLRDYANKDPLTGLYNRRYLFESGMVLHATALRNRVPIAVFMIDIDRFKSINDTYGHQAGDLVIKTLANILTTFFKRKTDIVARIGGEEFCVLTSYEDPKTILPFAEMLRQHIESTTVHCNDKTISFTSSIGICIETKPTLEEMIKDADAFLYLAKSSGRNRVCM